MIYQDAAYVDTSPWWGIERPRCSSCIMFREVPDKFLGRCTKVEGSISPHGWCKFFEYNPDAPKGRGGVHGSQHVANATNSFATDTANPDEDTAYHEAGHAVAAFALKNSYQTRFLSNERPSSRMKILWATCGTVAYGGKTRADPNDASSSRSLVT